jgi:lipoprotein-anchoring transpeptidase ErfK/SrfK
MRARSRRTVVSAAFATGMVVAFALAACTSPSGSGGTNGPGGGTDPAVAGSGGNSSSTAASTPAAPPAVISITPGAAVAAWNPINPVTVAVADGRIDTVVVTNPDGAPVAGQVAPDGSTWATTEPLGYGKSYSVQVQALNRAGKAYAQSSSFTTVQPKNYTLPIFRFSDGGTYGVGYIAGIRFDEPIVNKEIAERALTVTTVPTVEGSWSWANNQDVEWRPRNYWPAGTQVSISAKVYGLELSPGIFGQADRRASFVIGQKKVAIADDTTKMIDVYFDDVLQRSMPTSMGKGGTQVVGTTTLSFWTQNGPHVVLGKQNPVLMDSETYGLPHAEGGYKIEVPYAVQISGDGEYVHWADWSVWAQGNTDTSHGCLNISPANATWFYGQFNQGDIVDVRNTDGRVLPPTIAGGEWNASYEQWVAGSAVPR